MPVMSSAYDQLLDATIQHLETLQARGVRHVAVSPETLQALAQPPPRSASPASSRRSEEAAPPTPAGPSRATAATRLPEPPRAATLPLPLAAPVIPSGVSTASDHSALTAEQKVAAFAALRERALACVKCAHLAASRKNVVFGVGSLEAALMFVGEAPGAEEDEQAEPFVGTAGQLLTKIITAMGLQREEVYIANILKCRPDTLVEATGNRKPTPEEMNACIPYLHEQIDLIRPRVLVALGGTAMEGLLNKTGITKLRGHWHTYRGIPLMPTFHPSYLLHNQVLAEKRRVWEDMLQVMAKLGMSISEKQQRFFLKG